MNMLFDSTVALYTQEVVLSTDPYNLLLVHAAIMESLFGTKNRFQVKTLDEALKSLSLCFLKMSPIHVCAGEASCPPALFPVGSLGIMGTDSLIRTQVLESQILRIKLGSLVNYISIKAGRFTHRPLGFS